MLILNPKKKLQKNSCDNKVSAKSDFYYCMYKFSACNFFQVNFFAFFNSNGFELSIKFCVLRYSNHFLKFLYQNILLTVKPNVEERAEKNKTKNIFYKCVLEWHFASISGLGGSILSKKVKIAVPLYTYLYSNQKWKTPKSGLLHW